MFAPLVVTLLLGAGVLGTASPAVAAPAYPPAKGRCVDTTGVLGPKLCAKVTTILLRDEARSSDEIAVAVVDGTGNATIEQWSTGLFNAWGVGKKDTNNGVLLVVAVDDRELRLETGRGMAERLSDDEAADIIDTVITPKFADEEYAAGILGGLDEVRRRLGHTVSKDARLLSLAAQAPRPAAVDPEDDDTAPDEQGPDMINGDGTIYFEDGIPVEGDVDTGVSFGGVVMLLMVAAAVVGLIGVIVSRVRSAPWDGQGSGDGWSSGSTTHRTLFSSGSSESSSTSSSSFGSSDSSSGSSFGGGSSDGGGSSGSW
jgi:uncharacterized protein